MSDHPDTAFAARSRNARQSNIRAVSQRVAAAGGVNLGQGVCPLSPDPALVEAASAAMRAGHNVYTAFDGVPPLKEALVSRYRRYNGLEIGPQHVLATAGATGALECICKAFLEPGDEVVLMKPIYQYHTRLVEERGADIRYLRLDPPDWTFDVEALEAAFTERTKLFIFANPNNPSGKVFTRAELEAIGDACRRHGVLAVVDEVYEYFLSETQEHISLATLDGMFDHTLTLSSASKTFFVTGWRVGWLVGPERYMGVLGVKSDETYICAPAPFQHAVAHGLQMEDAFFGDLRRRFYPKRERLLSALRRAGFTVTAPQGAYYLLADYTALGFKSDNDAMETLIDEIGVGAVPGDEFFPGDGDTGLLRFCYALPEALLDEGCSRLERLGEGAAV